MIRQRHPRPSPTAMAVAAAACLLATAACSGNSAVPQPGQGFGSPPDLRGRRVVLMPVQEIVGVAGDPDAELAFTLTDRGRDIDWILSDEIQEVLDRSPAVQTRTRGLPVGVFTQAQVERVGDPLYGELRRIAALVDADAILLPVRLSYEANEAEEDATPRVRFTTALIEPRSGRVVWFGIEEGGDFAANDPRGLASAAEAVANTLLWYVGD